MRAVIVGGIGVALAVLLWIAFVDETPEGAEPIATGPTEVADDTPEGVAALTGRGVVSAGPERPESVLGTAVIRGQVVDEDAKPLAGIAVELRLIQKTDRFRWRPSKFADDQFKPPVDAELIDVAQSGADGWVEFRGLQIQRTYELRARAKAPYYGAHARVYPSNNAMPPVLMLGEGVPLRVRIVDGAGEGLGGWVSAGVSQSADHRGWNQGGGWKLPHTETGASGRLTIPAVPETALTFNVTIPGLGARYGIEVRPPFDEEVLLRFGSSGGPVIFGTVSDSSGSPISGARLIATVNPRGPTAWAQRTLRIAQSDKSGQYRIEGLPTGFLTSLPVHANGYIYVQNAAPQMEVAGEQELEVDVTLYRGGVVEGTVRGPEGEPIAGARLIASPPGNNYWNSRGTTAVSDAAGHFRIADVPLGKGQIGGHADGYYMPTPKGVKVNRWQAPPGVLFEVKEEGQHLIRDVELVAGVRLEGRVVGPDKEPVLGARVWGWGNLQQRIQPFDQYALQRVTDADGRFVYAGLPPGAQWSFNASTSEGNAKAVQVMLTEGKEAEPVELVLMPRGGIRGMIDTGTRTERRRRNVHIRGKQGGGSYTVATRADGAFEQRGLKAGTYTVHVNDGLGRRAGPAATVEVVDGEWTEDVKITVEATLDLRGLVVDLEGEPVPNLRLRLYYKQPGSTRWSNSSTNTKPDGRFRWSDLLPGEYELKMPGESTRHRVSPGEEEQKYIHIVPPKDIVAGTVTGPDGRPVAGGYVSIRRMRSRGNWNGSSAQIVNGRFRGEAPAGDGDINVSVDNATDAFGRKLNVLPFLYEDYNPASGPLEIKLEEGKRIAGQVLDPSGKPAPHMGVHIQAENRNGRKWYGYYNTGYGTNLRTDEEGRFEMLGLSDRRYEVYVQTGGLYLMPEPVNVDAGSTNVIVRLEPGLTIQGRVSAEAKGGIAGASVSYSWSTRDRTGRKHTSYRNASSGPDGSFELTGLPFDAVGSLRVNPPSSSKSGFIGRSLRDVGAGQTGLEVVLEAGGFIEGSLRGPAGEPLGRFRVRAYVHNGSKWIRKYSARSSNDGTFKIGPVSTNLYQLRVDARGEYSASPGVDVRAPASDVVVEVPKGQSVRGTVLGDNVRNFQVIWYYRDSAGAVKTKNGSVKSNGSFFINQPSEDLGTLYVRRTGDHRYAILEDVRPMDGPFEIRLSEGLTVSGYVDNIPSSRRWVSVWARDAAGRYASGSVKRDGSFEIRGMAPGTYTLGGNIRPGKIGQKKDVEAGASGVVLPYSPN